MHTSKGKVVLITGSAAGIGACIAEEFLKDGAELVAGLDIDETKGISLETDLNKKYGAGKFVYFKCDLRSTKFEDVFNAILDNVGYVDIVVNNAGIYNDSSKFYIQEIDVNFKATVTISLKLYNLMRQDRGGRGGTIINIASTFALGLYHYYPVYASTKRAVIHFSSSLGLEPHFSRSKVRVMTTVFGGTCTGSSVTGFDLQFDEETNEEFFSASECYQLQSPESAARGVLDVYHQGLSGSVWLAAFDDLAKDITDSFLKSYSITEEVIKKSQKKSKL